MYISTVVGFISFNYPTAFLFSLPFFLPPFYGCKYQLTPLWSQARKFTPLILNFLLCKIGLILSHRVCYILKHQEALNASSLFFSPHNPPFWCLKSDLVQSIKIKRSWNIPNLHIKAWENSYVPINQPASNIINILSQVILTNNIWLLYVCSLWLSTICSLELKYFKVTKL